ncbi:hypothetical protein CSC17_0391 [Klebsiella oxytoca]|nr:hypothetical protein CSC17_0391 [Klebsiella oxytoca]
MKTTAIVVVFYRYKSVCGDELKRNKPPEIKGGFLNIQTAVI